MENIQNKLSLIYGDWSLGIKGENFHYIFSYSRGGIESINKNGKEWLYRVPTPTFWRATTDNDRGSKFPVKSAMWIGADMFIDYRYCKVYVDDKSIETPKAPFNNIYSDKQFADRVLIEYYFKTATNPATDVIVKYLVENTGKIKVTLIYKGIEELPSLPALGMRFISPTLAHKYIYKGISGETYPDRKAGGVEGIYEISDVDITPYLVPQDSAMHMDTEYLDIYRASTLDNTDAGNEEFSLRFEMEQEKFAFSCVPYTAMEIENATHIEELPPKRRTVTCIYARVRGVGGIDSWGSDVESAYHISAQEDVEFSFFIK